MTAKIFISHSCKDHEEHPPEGLSAEEINERAGRLRFARELRTRLFEKLNSDNRCTVFLDVRGGLNPGDVWQDGLHTALRHCSGGVILLSPEALESGWVLKEATILSWRVFLGEPILLVPIVLGVSDADLSKRGFGALNLEQIQWVRVADTSDESLENAVEAAVNALEPVMRSALVEDRELSHTERWILELASRLGKVIPDQPAELRNDNLVRMCRALAIIPQERARFDEDPLVNLASQALVANGDQIVRFLNNAGSPDRSQREELSNAVVAMWVDPAPASRLLLAAAKHRVVAIDATEIRSVREYVLRAFCNYIYPDRIIEPSDVTTGSEADVIDEIETALIQVLPIEDADELAHDIQDNGPAFVLLGPGSARPQVLDEVTQSYPQLTFVIATGARPREKLGAWWDRVILLQPVLQPRREIVASRFRNKLLAFVKGRVSQ
ncbi:MAG: toll/interleukin-1 receptor domain-containing protein [Candidatus Thiodiazotropha taylori]